MSTRHAKVSSAILFLLTVSLLATACDDPTGPSPSDTQTAAHAPRPNMDPGHRK